MKMRDVLIILSLATFLSCSDRPDRLLEQAVQLDALERYTEAIVVYDKLLALDSTNTSVWIARAYDKGRIGNADGEMADLKQAVKVGAEHALPFFQLGITYSDRKQYAEAIEWFNKATLVKGGGPIYMDMVDNDFIDRQEYLLDVPIVDIMFERGVAYYEVDSITNAHRDFTFCIESKHNLKESYYGRACTYLRADMLKAACDDLKMAELYGSKAATELLEKYCR